MSKQRRREGSDVKDFPDQLPPLLREDLFAKQRVMGRVESRERLWRIHTSVLPYVKADVSDVTKVRLMSTGTIVPGM
eukprot:scaffold11161_cov52-Attheya_sp.AAC.4